MTNSYSVAVDNLLTRLSKQGIQLDSLPTAIYARKSTKDETQISIPSQIEYCKKYIEGEKRLKLVKVYQEDKISGYRIEGRKQFTALLEEARRGNIRAIVYYALDRETRNDHEGSGLDLELKKLGVLQIYATQSFEDNATGRFTKTVIRAEGQRHVEDVSERVLPAMDKTAKKCQSTGGKCLYGYKVNELKKYVVNEEEKDAVKLMFDLALSGSTIPDISVELAKKGYLTRAHKPFPVNTIWNMLRNEKYKGEYIYFNKNRRKNKNRVSDVEMDEVRIKGGIPQIIDEKTFNKVQLVLDCKTNKSTPRVIEDYPLRGYIFCGESGRQMHGEISYGGDSRKKYTRYTTPRGDLVKRSIKKEIIESATAEVIASILNKINENYIDTSKMMPSLKGRLQSELTQLQNKISSTKKELISSVKSLCKLNNDDTIKIVQEEIDELQKVLNSMVGRKAVLEQELCSFNKCIKTILRNGINLTGEDILKDSTVFKKSLSLFIQDIKIYEDEIVYNLKDLLK